MIEQNALTLNVFSQNLGRRRLPVGRFTVAVGGTKTRARRRGSDRVVALCAAALTAAGRFIDLRRRRTARRDARGGGAAMAADKRVDARTRSVYKHLTSCVETYEGEEKGKAAQRLLDEYFPEGLGAIINAPYEEELVMVEHIVEAFNGPEAALIDGLGARMFVDAVDAVLPEYRDALALEELVTATEVAGARDAMHLLMLRIVATILADHGDDLEALRELMAPIDDQTKRLGELYAARRRGQSTGGLDLEANEAADVARGVEADDLADRLMGGDDDLDGGPDQDAELAGDGETGDGEADGPSPSPLPGNANINLPVFARGEADRG